MKMLQVTENEAGQRLNKLLGKYLSKAASSFIYKMLRKKNIVLNGKKASGNEMLLIGDEIKLFLSDETIQKFSSQYTNQAKGNVKVVYEDAHILIVNKPAGLLSQKADSDGISLNEQVIAYLLNNHSLNTDELRTFKPAVCNRLDRNTSGLVICGKTLKGLQLMSEALKNRSMHKYYRCIVKGNVEQAQSIKGYLIKDEAINKVEIFPELSSQCKQEEALPIETEYIPITHTKDCTLLEVKLITGRTHQIRAHLASIAHPILGDYKYGAPTFNNFYKTNYGIESQLLHAYRIEMPDFQGEWEYLAGKIITADMPEIFNRIMSKV